MHSKSNQQICRGIYNFLHLFICSNAVIFHFLQTLRLQLSHPVLDMRKIELIFILNYSNLFKFVVWS